MWPLGQWWLSLLRRAEHMVGTEEDVIFGGHGGPSYSSTMEVNRILRWSSTPPYHQVVRPRGHRGGRRKWFFIGREFFSVFLLYLGGNTLRSLETGGGG